MTVVGQAYVEIIPVTAGFGTAVAKEIESGMTQGVLAAEKAITATEAGVRGRSQEFARGVGESFGLVPLAAAKSGKAAGEELNTGIREGGAKAAKSAEEAGQAAGEGFKGKLLTSIRGGLGALASLGLELGPIESSIDKMADKVEHTGGKATDTLKDKIANLGRTTALVGGVGFAAFTVGAAKMASDFQTQTANMASNANITIKAAQDIGKAFMSEGPNITATAAQQEQAYGQVAAQLQAVQGHALNTKEAVEFMRNSMDLAEVSGEGLGQATGTLSQVMASFQVPMAQTAKVTTDLFNASRLSQTSVDALGGTMDRLKSRLGVAAPTVEDLSTLMVDLGEHGVTGGRGLNIVNGAINTLLTSTNKLDAAQAAAANTQSTKVVAAQKAVQAATDALTSAQQSAGNKQASSALAVETAQNRVAQAAVLLQEAQAKAALAAGGSAAAQVTAAAGVQKAQLNLQGAQEKLAAAQQKGSGTSTAVQKATEKLAETQKNLQTVESGSGQITNAHVAALTKLGLTVYDAHGKFVGMRDIIAQLQPKLQGLTQQQQLATLANVFGAGASKALLDTVLAGPAAYDKANKAVTDHAAYEHALQVQQKTLGYEFEAIKTSAINLATSFGSVVLPVVQKLLHAFGDFFAFLESHKAVLYALGAAVTAVLGTAIAVWIFTVGERAVAATKRFASSIDNVLSKIPGLNKIFKGSSAEQVSALEAQQAATDRLTASTERLTATLQQAAGVFGETAAAAESGVTAEITSVEELDAAMQRLRMAEVEAAAANEALGATADAVTVQLEGQALATGQLGVEEVTQESAEAAGVIERGLDAIATGAAAVADAALAAAEGIAAIASAALDIALAPITLTIGAIVLAVAALGFGIYELVTHWKTVWGAITKAMEAAWHFIKTYSVEIAAAMAILLGPIGLIGGAIVLLLTHWRQVWGAMQAAAEAFGRFIARWWPLLLAPLTGGLSLAAKFLIDHWQAIWGGVRRIFGDFVNFVKNWWPVLLGVLGGPFGIAIGLFVKFRSQIVQEAENIASGVGRWISRMVGDVVHFIEGLPGKILHVFANAGTLLVQAGKDIIHGLIHGIEQVPVVGPIVKVASGVLGHFKRLFHIFSPSQVMADEVGAPLVQGMAQGINIHASSVDAAINKLGGDTTGTLKQLSQRLKADAKLVGDAFAQIDQAVKKARDSLKGSLGQLSGQLETFGKSIRTAVGPIKDGVKPFEDFEKSVGAIGKSMQRDVTAVATFAKTIASLAVAMKAAVPALAAFTVTLGVAAPAIAKVAPRLNEAVKPLNNLAAALKDIDGPMQKSVGLFNRLADAMRNLAGAVVKLAEALRASSPLLIRFAVTLERTAPIISRMAPLLANAVKPLELLRGVLNDINPPLKTSIDRFNGMASAMRNLASEARSFVGHLKTVAVEFASSVNILRAFSAVLDKTVVGLKAGVAPLGQFIERLKAAAAPLLNAIGPMKAAVKPLDEFARTLQTVAKALGAFADQAVRFVKAVDKLRDNIGPLSKAVMALNVVAAALPPTINRLTVAFENAVKPLGKAAGQISGALGPLKQVSKPMEDFAKAANDTAKALDNFTRAAGGFTKTLPPLAKDVNEFQKVLLALGLAAAKTPGILQSLTKALQNNVGPMRQVTSDTSKAIKPLQDAVKPLNDFNKAAKDLSGSVGHLSDGVKNLKTDLPIMTREILSATKAVDDMHTRTQTFLGKDTWKNAADDIKSVWDTITTSTEKAWQNLSGFFRTAYANEATKTAKDWVAIRNTVLQGLFGMIVGVVNTANGISNVFAGLAARIISNINSHARDFRNAGEAIVASIAAGITGTAGSLLSALAAKIGTSGVAAGAGSKPPSFQTGGPVPGPSGEPVLAIVHAGEYVIGSDEMTALTRTGFAPLGPGGGSLAGFLAPNVAASPAPAAVPAAAQAASGPPVNIQQTFYTPMNAADVANEVGWLLRTAAIAGGIRTVL